MNDSTLTFLRAILKVGGGYLVAKGIADDSQITDLIGGAIALIGIIAGFLKAKKTQALK